MMNQNHNHAFPNLNALPYERTVGTHRQGDSHIANPYPIATLGAINLHRQSRAALDKQFT